MQPVLRNASVWAFSGPIWLHFPVRPGWHSFVGHAHHVMDSVDEHATSQAVAFDLTAAIAAR